LYGRAGIISCPALFASWPVDHAPQHVPLELSSRELSLCGFGATVFGDIVTHPLGTIKTMQQSVGKY
jgi:hypothetical protein